MTDYKSYERKAYKGRDGRYILVLTDNGEGFTAIKLFPTFRVSITEFLGYDTLTACSEDGVPDYEGTTVEEFEQEYNKLNSRITEIIADMKGE